MDRKQYQSALFQAVISRKVLLGFVSLLLLSNTFLAIGLATNDPDRETVVTPPDFNKPFTIKNGTLDSSYVEQMSRYFASLLWTYTPDTVSSNFDIVQSFAHPSRYGDIRTFFSLEKEKIRKKKISSVFHPLRVHATPTSAKITGEQRAFIGSQPLEPKVVTYNIRYLYQEGSLYILSFTEVSPDKGDQS